MSAGARPGTTARTPCWTDGTVKGCGRNCSTDIGAGTSGRYTGSPGTCNRSCPSSTPSARRRCDGRLRRSSRRRLSSRTVSRTGRPSHRMRSRTRGGDPASVVPRSAGNRRRGGALSRRGARSCRRGAHLASRRASRDEGSRDLPRHGREWVRAPRGVRADRRRALARAGTSLRRPRAGAGAPSAR